MKKRIMALALAAMMAASMTAYAAPEDDAAAETEASTEETREGIGEKIADDAMEAIVNVAIDEADKAGDLEDDSDSDLMYIMHKGSFIVGVTEYAPLDYKDENGDWIGFDADMANAFAKQTGFDSVQFVEIDWDKKVDELNAKTIDCVWNGLSETDDIAEAMDCTDPYMNNSQVLVVKADEVDEYTDPESAADISFAVESGSSAQAILAALGYTNVTPVDTQGDALKAVEDGTCQAAVVDSVLAAAMTGEGKAYANLASSVSLASEQFVVGFRKGSDVPGMLNQFFAYGCQDGTVQDCANKYGIGEALIDMSSDTNFD